MTDPLAFLDESRVSAESGDFVFREREPGADMFIIRSGQVELLQERDGADRRVALLEPDDFFGEMSLLDGLPRETSARAVGRVELLRVDATTFNRVLLEAPELPVRMLRLLCNRVRERQQGERRAAAAASAVPTAVDNGAGAAGAVLVVATSRRTFSLSARGESTIGRADRVTGFSPDVDLSSLDEERTLSRRHAKIVNKDREYFVREEIGTFNGTFVNGQRVQTGVDVRLAAGDRVRFGRIETIFEIR